MISWIACRRQNKQIHTLPRRKELTQIDELRRNVALGLYELTSHAKLEMQADQFTMADVKQGIYSGRIIARDPDPSTSVRYRISGKAADARKIQILCRMTSLGQLRIITAFEE
jgi:hypothetical protein